MSWLKKKKPKKIISESRIEYRLDGELHREDGPAVEEANGSKLWFIHGKLHREDGPAVKDPIGYEAWCFHGKRHRTDGPAVSWVDGPEFWWVNGIRLTEAEFNETRYN